MKDYAKAIESYENLAQVAGDDPDVQFALGVLYENKGVFDKAREHFGKVLKVDPKYIDTLLASGRVEIKSNNAQTGLDYLNRALTLAILAACSGQPAKTNAQTMQGGFVIAARTA